MISRTLMLVMLYVCACLSGGAFRQRANSPILPLYVVLGFTATCLRVTAAVVPYEVTLLSLRVLYVLQEGYEWDHAPEPLTDMSGSVHICVCFD